MMAKLYWRVKKNGKWTWTPWTWSDDDFDKLWTQEESFQRKMNEEEE